MRTSRYRGAFQSNAEIWENWNRMKPNTSELADVSNLNIDLSKIPALLDCEGVRTYLAPIGHSLLYELAAAGEIESASLGLGRGRRVFVTASIADWLRKRAAQSKRPNVAPRRPRRVEGEEGATRTKRASP